MAHYKVFTNKNQRKKFKTKLGRIRRKNLYTTFNTNPDLLKNQNSCVVCSHNPVKDFCANTTIHGVKYLYKSSWKTQIFWVIAYTFALSSCGYLVHEQYKRYKTRDPVIITFDEQFKPISDIPFPAVTICPEIKVDFKKFNFSEVLTKANDFFDSIDLTAVLNLTSYEKEAFQIIAPTVNPIKDNLSNMTSMRYPLTNISRVNEVLVNISLSLEDMCGLFRWSNSTQKRNCTEYFSPIITEYGLCYTFNSQNLTDPRTDQYLLRVHSVKEKFNLILKLNKNYYHDWFPSHGKGFRVFIHAPNQFPWDTKQYIKLRRNEIITITVSPKIMTTSMEVKEYDIKTRKCQLDNERRLDFFELYSQENCELEYLAKVLHEICGCIPFWMPRFENAKICTTREIECYNHTFYHVMGYSKLYSKNENGDYLNCKPKRESIGLREKGFDKINEKDSEENCVKLKLNNTKIKLNYTECLPGCFSVDYETEDRSNILNFDFEDDLYPSLDSNEDYDLAQLVVQFRDSKVLPMRRSQLNGFIDFISSFGGIMGLCLGISLVSLFEIIYYGTIELVSLMQHLKEKPLKPEDISVLKDLKRKTSSGSLSEGLIDNYF